MESICELSGQMTHRMNKLPLAKCGTDTQMEAKEFFCIRCRYSLRGLCGDPRVCPECGYQNQLAELLIPADRVHEELRRLETVPTLCVIAFGVSMIGWFICALGHAVTGLLLGSTGLFVWFICALLFGWVSRFRHGWLGVLLSFHLAALVVLSLLAGFAVAFTTAYAYGIISGGVLLAILLTIGIGGMSSGARRLAYRIRSSAWLPRIASPYAHARTRLGSLCWEVAVKRILNKRG